VKDPRNRGPSRRRSLHTCAEASLRHGVPEPIGLGISFRRMLVAFVRAGFAVEGAGPGLKPQALPLARDLSAG
jgi:hypothetical protein